MDKKIGYGIAGSVLVLALVFSLYTPESNLVGYASKSLVVDDLFDTGSYDVVQQNAAGGDGGIGGTACTPENAWNVCSMGWGCFNGYCRKDCFDNWDCRNLPLFPECRGNFCMPEIPDDDGYWTGCGCGKSCWVPRDDPGDEGNR
jgi:hypothetical protein